MSCLTTNPGIPNSGGPESGGETLPKLENGVPCQADLVEKTIFAL